MNVGCRHLLHQRQAHRALGPGLGQERGPGSFRLLAIKAPEVRVPRSGETKVTHDDRAANRIGPTTRVAANAGNVHARAGAANAERRKLLRPGNLHLCLLLQDALSRDAEIVIVGERLTNQILQLRLVEHLGPLLIAERALRVADDRGIVRPAECGWSGIRGPLVLGPNRAPGRRG